MRHPQPGPQLPSLGTAPVGVAAALAPADTSATLPGPVPAPADTSATLPGTAAFSGTPAARVLSIPAHHPFVQTTWPAAAEAVVPAGFAPGLPWQPHPGLDADWLRAHAAGIDAVHIHFGFEHRSPAELATLTQTCRETGTGLVLTVHDLTNPHLATAAEQAEHRARLRVLTAAADAVFTLTTGAAEEIAAAYGVHAEVIAHPPIVPAAAAAELTAAAGIGAPRTPAGHRAVAVLKDLRANVVTDPDYYRRLAAGLHAAGAHLDVLIHRTSAAHPTARALREAAPQPGLRVQLSERLSDARLHGLLAGYDLAVLPYSHGTHSGWLEMCRDLGLTVIAPDCGHYAGQADRPGAVRITPVGDGAAAAEACVAALRSGPVPRARVGSRAAVAQDAYARAYAHLITGTQAPTASGAGIAQVPTASGAAAAARAGSGR